MIRWTERVVRVGKKRNTGRFLVEENLKDVAHLEDLSVDALTTLAWILRHKRGVYGLD
jgi:hypothetical protein